ncbi:MAG: response regulator transcription factor [Lachnospiraceae bacterium]|nr:response regulator transcription factor [Lachnospiraceae bacterium]MBP5746023.1 response regulator transcription factor [Lachnospiraceae bacterium]
MINIMLVDDHVLFRESLRVLIEKDKFIKVSCEAANMSECINCLRFHDVDIILLDITLDDENGLDILEFIRKKKINTKVIMLTMHKEIENLVRAMELKTNGYLLKTITHDELFTAIHDVYGGIDYIQPDLLPYLNNYLINKDIDREKIKLLTARELELLKMIASGKKNLEIATALDISERTVKNHLSHVFDKLQVADRTQAAVFAIRNKLN